MAFQTAKIDENYLIKKIIAHVSGAAANIDFSKALLDEAKFKWDAEKLRGFINGIGDHDSSLSVRELFDLMQGWQNDPAMRPQNYGKIQKDVDDLLAERQSGKMSACEDAEIVGFAQDSVEPVPLASGKSKAALVTVMAYRWNNIPLNECPQQAISPPNASQSPELPQEGARCPLPGKPRTDEQLELRIKFNKHVTHILWEMNGAGAALAKAELLANSMENKLHSCGFPAYAAKRDEALGIDKILADYAVSHPAMRDQFSKAVKAGQQEPDFFEFIKKQDVDFKTEIEKKEKAVDETIKWPAACPSKQDVEKNDRQINERLGLFNKLRAEYMDKLDKNHDTGISIKEFMPELNRLNKMKLKPGTRQDVNFAIKVLKDPKKRKIVAENGRISWPLPTQKN
jgi:hypothetical protein